MAAPLTEAAAAASASRNLLASTPFCQSLVVGSFSDHAYRVAIAIACSSSFLGVLSLLLIKQSTNSKSMPMYALATVLLAGACLGGASLHAVWLAPLSLIAPLGATALGCSALLARLVKERVKPVEWLVLILMVGVLVCAAVYGPESEYIPLSYADWQARFQRVEVIGHLAATFGVALLLLLCRCCPAKKLRPKRKGVASVLLNAFAAALLGSYSQLFVKVICAAIVEAADPASTVVEVDVAQLWLLWLSVGLLVLVAPIQLVLLTGALRAGKASFAVPAYTSMLVPLTIVLDGVYFRAISCWSRDTIIVYVTTLVVLIVGVLLLACQQDRGDEGKVGIVGVDDESPGQSDYEEAEEEPARPMPTAVEPAKMVADRALDRDGDGRFDGMVMPGQIVEYRGKFFVAVHGTTTAPEGPPPPERHLKLVWMPAAIASAPKPLPRNRSVPRNRPGVPGDKV